VQCSSTAQTSEVDPARERSQTEAVDTEERQDHEDQAVSHVIDRLAEKFPDRPRSLIEEVVSEERHLLDDKPLRDYIPVLIEHGAKSRLRTAARMAETAS